MTSAMSTIFVVDDDGSVRDSVRWVLESANYQVKTFESAESFWEGYNSACAGCLILDACLPGMTGLELHEEISRHPNAPPVICLTGRGNIPLAVRAIQQGAVAFLEKPVASDVLLETVKGALAQDRARRRWTAEIIEAQARIASLTGREREVLDFVVASKSSKDIASELGLSFRTVENHRAQILRKMNVSSSLDLVRMVLAADRGFAPSLDE